MQPRLQEIKKEFERFQSEFILYQNLTQEREGVLAQIQTLKNSTEADRVHLHRLQDVHPQKALFFMGRIEEHEEQTRLLRGSLKKIDAQLDQLGEEKDAAAAQSKHELLCEIQEHFPESRTEYAVAETALRKASEQNKRLQEMQERLAPLHYLLQQGAQIPLKGLSFLSFLWGRHPQAMLARRIHQAFTLAEKNLAHIQDARFKSYLDKFLKEVTQPSNRALYQGKFSELANEFSSLMDELNEEILQSNEELFSYEQAIEKWFERYCNLGNQPAQNLATQ